MKYFLVALHDKDTFALVEHKTIKADGLLTALSIAKQFSNDTTFVASVTPVK